MTVERPAAPLLSRRRMLATGGIAAGAALAGGLLTGCSGPSSTSTAGGGASSASTPEPPPSPPPAALSALTTPVGFDSIPFKDGKRQPAMIKVLKPDDFFVTDPEPVWTFAGDPGWTSFNGFKFRTMDSRTVALMIGARGHLAIVPVEPSVQATTTPADTIWQSPEQLKDNPHAAELVPAGNYTWPGGKGTAPYLFVVAAPGDGGSLTVHDIDEGTTWRTPFPGGHGVVWDRQGKRLWALGSSNLSSYRLQKYGKNKGKGEIVDHTGSGWGLADERLELDAPGLGHDLEPDYSSHGTHLLMTTPSKVYRVPKKHPRKATELALATGNKDEPSYKGSQKVKSIARTSSGLYLWVRLQAHAFNPNAVYTDNAIFVGKAASGGKVTLAATLQLPKGDWTYAARPLNPDYS